MLKPGDHIPSFSLTNDAGKTVTHRDLEGRRAVIYFYPKDDTPGCTVEAVDFTARAGDFAKANVAVFGVSRDSVASHCRFRDKHKLKVSLLSDPDLVVHRAFGVWGEKMMYGKKVEGTIRSTFVVETDGTIAQVWSPVKVPGHVDAVLTAVTGTSVPAATKKMPTAKKRA